MKAFSKQAILKRGLIHLLHTTFFSICLSSCGEEVPTNLTSHGISWYKSNIVNIENSNLPPIVKEIIAIQVEIAGESEAIEAHLKYVKGDKQIKKKVNLSNLGKLPNGNFLWEKVLGKFSKPVEIQYTLFITAQDGFVFKHDKSPDNISLAKKIDYNFGTSSEPESGNINVGDKVKIYTKTSFGIFISSAFLQYKVKGSDHWNSVEMEKEHYPGTKHLTWFANTHPLINYQKVRYRFLWKTPHGRQFIDENKGNYYWLEPGSNYDLQTLTAYAYEHDDPLEIKRKEVHQDILNQLSNNKIKEIKLLTGDIEHKNDVFKVIFERNNLEKPLKQAIFKKIYKENKNLNDNPRMEKFAYNLNRLLGMDMVPPAVIRTIDDQEGTLIYFIENLVPENKIFFNDPFSWFEAGENLDDTDRDLLFSDVIILDSLLYNSDRQGQMPNMVLGTHWFLNKKRLILIDQAASFTPWSLAEIFSNANSPFVPFHAFNWHLAFHRPITVVRKSTLAHLASLDEMQLKPFIENDILTDFQASLLLQKKDEILNYFKSPISIDGFDIKIIDRPSLY